KTVQVIPHITDEIKRRIQLNGQTKQFDIIITEIGGTVGDIESLPFIESVRQLRNSLGYQNTALVHLAWVPYLAASGEVKTKPTQHSVKALLENGLQPDVLVLRAENPLETSIKRKIALFCNVMPEAVIESVDMPTIYEVPLRLYEQKMDLVVMQRLGLPTEDSESDLTAWRAFVDKVKNPTKSVDVALVGKYTELPDAYKSINESFIHAGAMNDCKVKVKYINAEKVNAESAAELFKGMSGIFVAPGSGSRGVDGKIAAVKYAREAGIPFFGVGLGMHCAIVEFARDVLGIADAASAELDKTTKHPVIDLMEEQKGVTEKGDTMRLGGYVCTLNPESKAAKAYGITSVIERHSHRYEFNTEYREAFEAAGLQCVGINPETGLVEVMELDNHPWFIATQYHPEYKSTVEHPAPLFVSFVSAALKFSENNK
ncbi:MAG: CTP synthase, partial [Alistipes sp.]|nr:CTP synthase [Alistipes sp.]